MKWNGTETHNPNEHRQLVVSTKGLPPQILVAQEGLFDGLLCVFDSNLIKEDLWSWEETEHESTWQICDITFLNHLQVGDILSV